ncbi:hypothetical protein CXB51_016903 [Gossypium anomalum]|uniref:HAT C-terminal dimerisation domain-containing protein n=1 Tax=Gossypium anomalum TaxID=47600 RepID=A0A8J5YER6_9ROSI|nr:hypothetical protein CXB51_016903 [Gossypium anomalum]
MERVFTITVDNASANSVAIEYLKKKLNHRNASIANGKFIHMRYVAHILNLIVQYGIKDASVSVDRVRSAVRYIRASPPRLTKFNQRGEGNNINMLVYLAVIFDLRWKMSFLDFGVNLLFPNVANDIMEMIDKELHCLFNEYSYNVGRIQLFEGRSSSSTNLCSSMEIDQSEMKRGLAKQKYLKKKKQVGLENKSKLDRYLGKDEELNNSSSFDLLLWWKINSPRFPILAQMAQDIFAIPILTVALESAFSTGEHVLDSFRSSATPLTLFR